MGAYACTDEERKILDLVTRDPSATVRDMARAADTDEKSANRIFNRLLAEGICSQKVIPNYARLGFGVLIVQRLALKSGALPDASMLGKLIRSEWKNCIDCHETFDGKLYVRSVWKDASEFKAARNQFHQKHKVDWLADESVDMIPIDEKTGLMEVRSLWGGEGS